MAKKMLILVGVVGGMLVLGPTAVMAQPPDTLWTRTYGGSDHDWSYSVQQTGDGGYIITGYTESYGAGGEDVFLIKTDASGNRQWSQTFGGSHWDCGWSVQQTSDGGYIIAGETLSYGAGGDDVYLIKTDASGNQQWSQTFGGSFDDVGKSVQQTGDGGYIIAGWTESYGAGHRDVYLIKTDASGNRQWSQIFGGSENDRGCSVQQTSDGGYIIAGYTYSYGAGENDVYLIKTDVSGIEQWSRTFGGSYSDYGESVQQTSDEGYIITGWTESYGTGKGDVYLIKTDVSGIEQWSQTFGGSSYDYGCSVQQTSNGGYIVAGITESYDSGGRDVYLIKTDASGIEQWSQTCGGSHTDGGESVQQTTDGGYIIAGGTWSYGPWFDVWLIRLEPEGGYPDVTITLVPFTWPIQIPATGGSFEFYAFVANNQGEPISVNLWTDALLPDSSIVGPLMGPGSVTLNVGTTGWYRIQTVPAYAPAGIYAYNAYVGDEFGNVWNEDHFEFEKLTVGEGSVIGDWVNTGESLGEEGDSRIAPTEPAVIRTHPNPFNLTTTISYELPVAGWVKLAVYDISGCLVGAQRAAPLLDEWLEAGTHDVTFDGSNLASGIYIYRLEAGEFSASGKMVLLK